MLKNIMAKISIKSTFLIIILLNFIREVKILLERRFKDISVVYHAG
jgi:hypothetical protein